MYTDSLRSIAHAAYDYYRVNQAWNRNAMRFWYEVYVCGCFVCLSEVSEAYPEYQDMTLGELRDALEALNAR